MRSLSEEKEINSCGATQIAVGETHRKSEKILTRFYFFLYLLRNLEVACNWKKFKLILNHLACFISGVVLPFEPATITFENVQYFVDTPKVLELYLLFVWFSQLILIHIDLY